jgi:Domain of unknown function (DUF5666)
MERLRTAVVLASLAMAPLSVVHAQSQPVSGPQPDLKSATTTGDFDELPLPPRGKSTILGGQIRNVDPVLDQFTLAVVGQRPLKILFDARTQLFRNGTVIPLRDLRSEEHASVQTVLDGGNVYALSIHVLSQTPEGEAQGHVLSYDPATLNLTLNASLSSEPIRLTLRDDTPVVREGQAAFTAGAQGKSDLVNGSLVVVRFEANGKGQAVANHVTVLARPGSSFVFSGTLASLDMHAGLLVLRDPRDGKEYQISFSPAKIAGSDSLHAGDQVRITAGFDDGRYTATEITPSQSKQP